jgi:hypothetical protein
VNGLAYGQAVKSLIPLDTKMTAVAQVDRTGMGFDCRLPKNTIRADDRGLRHSGSNQYVLLAPGVEVEIAAFPPHPLRKEVHLAFNPAQDVGNLRPKGDH